MRRIVALLVLVLLAASHVPSEAAGPLQMAVRPGFSGAAKIGTWVPVEVELQNTGSEVTGEVQIRVEGQTNRSSFNRPPVTYSVPVTLPERSRKRFSLGIYFPGFEEKIEAHLVANGQTQLTQEVTVERVLATEMFCGALAGDRAALDVLTTLDLVGQQRRVRLAHLAALDIPSAPHLLQSLDCLILANTSTGNFTASQKDALRHWVDAGGLLVLGGGAGTQKTLGSLPAELLPIAVAGSVPLHSLDALAAFVGDPLPEQGPWLVGDATVTRGVTVIEQDGVPLLVAAQRGQGVVVYLGLDPTADPLRTWRGTATLWRHLLSYAPSPRVTANNFARGYTGWGRIPRIALSDFTQTTNVSVSWLIYVLLGYVTVVGPGNYLALRRLGHLEWSMITIPTATIGITIGALMVARANPARDLLVSNLTILRSWDGQVALARSYTSLYSLREQSAALRFPEGSHVLPLFYPFPLQDVESPPAWMLKVQQRQFPEVSGLALRPGSLGTVAVDHMYRLPGQITGDLMLEGQRVRGTITSQLAHPLHHVAVVVGGDVVRLGDLPSGATRTIEVDLVSPTVDLPSVVAQLQPTEAEEAPEEESGARDLLRSAFGTSFSSSSRVELSPATVVGWLDDAPLGDLTDGNRVAAAQRSLLISTLSLRVAPDRDAEISGPLMVRRSLLTTGTARERDGHLLFSNGDAIAWEYRLPVDPSRFAVDELRFDVAGSLEGVAAATSLASFSSAYLYDWRRAEWVSPNIDFGENRLGEPDHFISPLGVVRFRYVFRSPNASPNSVTATFSTFDLVVRGRGT